MGWTAFWLAYLLGGITFLPLVAAILFAHAYLTLPYHEDADNAFPNADDLVQPGDDVDALKAAQKDKEEAKSRTIHHDTDVAAGYFAVCREYTPMGINAKPIERSTPVGSATVAAPSPSVYQTMYRSIFDRKGTSSPLDNKNGASHRPKKAGNVFYVVLRHGHLMLFDDDEQLEVRHVVSLAHHDISIYSGEEVTPEGELWIKRNAICLSRRADGPELGPDSQVSKPFYLFSENCSAKEDFYFALLRNQELSFPTEHRAPTPIQFEVKNIISLVQKLHSSEEHMQTRWLNAMIGRIFLGIYKTKDIENLIREKLTKKISRVKRPAFLSNIEIKAIDTGDSAPYITNPRLKDLTVEGECGVEADMRYTGNFRLEVAATARIDLGARFKAREVNMVLAVVVRKLEGHIHLKIKPPPSNRLWFSFQQAPKMEMTIEPIVSSRQITYNVILRQIESRIKEVIAETLVLPFWDDTPFFNTEHKKWRGGIFHDDRIKSTMDLETAAAQDGELDEVDRLEETQGAPETELPQMEKSHSVPVLEKKTSIGLFGRKMKSKTDLRGSAGGSTSSLDLKADPRTSVASFESNRSDAKSSSLSLDSRREVKSDLSSSQPPVLSVPFAQPATPTVGTDPINADLFKPSSSPPNGSPAISAMANLSAQAQPPSPALTPVTNAHTTSSSSVSSRDATDTEKDLDKTPQGRRNTASSSGSHDDGRARSRSPSASIKGSVKSQTGSIARGFFNRRDTGSSASDTASLADTKKGAALAAVTNAAASAKRWGLNAFQRRLTDAGSATDGAPPHLDLNQPMGRGQPLPPPGTPLPMPDKSIPVSPIPVPKKKPIPPPSISSQSEDSSSHKVERRPVPPPSLPKRRQYQSDSVVDDGHNMLVVAAPADSEPTTPLSGSHSPSWIEDGKAIGDSSAKSSSDMPVIKLNGENSGSSPEAAPIDKTQPRREGRKGGGSTKLVVDDDDDDYSAWMEDPLPDDDLDSAVEPSTA
ncbi:uncharacterized protein PODANS_1_20700 [Podospora anserina S mat+]|uniref:Podospora anserina S mat+ genomic DNA chromosome 1, supercontig 5 n=1 Tax=Podospora anserina (strain S / ATCC MYA-4624 / DSM 980 / FGSC 10383) TaxID=515849 RepID=B2ABH6_PODAN|nr:uncharacterized protein PODANS_1_20700 [Podospora anserina S mat+]CAP60798.1 unnamed protein product [Podospora anserina S mat+]CDP24461.1 Putative protein of unknown function [Podospora anserina S mat+]